MKVKFMDPAKATSRRDEKGTVEKTDLVVEQKTAITGRGKDRGEKRSSSEHLCSGGGRR